MDHIHIKFENTLINNDYKDSNKKIVTYKLQNGSAKVVKVYLNPSNQKIETDTGHVTLSEGLVNKGNTTGNVCLMNIDKSHWFCINDRQDTYEDISEKTTSSYSYNYLGEDEDTLSTYVFGDVYQSESSTRHALDRVISGSDTSQRYNRNVGEYVIVAGDLIDQKNNITPELITFVSTFIRELESIAKVIVIAGNHDLIVNNLSRKDAISSIFETAAFDNAFLLDMELSYQSGYVVDDNITWCLYSIFDNFNKRNKYLNIFFKIINYIIFLIFI